MPVPQRHSISRIGTNLIGESKPLVGDVWDAMGSLIVSGCGWNGMYGNLSGYMGTRNRNGDTGGYTHVRFMLL